jgi:hypothetical protein
MHYQYTSRRGPGTVGGASRVVLVLYMNTTTQYSHRLYQPVVRAVSLLVMDSRLGGHSVGIGPLVDFYRRLSRRRDRGERMEQAREQLFLTPPSGPRRHWSCLDRPTCRAFTQLVR